MFECKTRQVHLDFHTSELIENIGAQFEPKEFAQMVKEANINSMTVFARCHHGMLYYQSKENPERIHPHLVRPNLLVEQVDALHEQGINAPVYITVQWDYYSATRRPEWLIRKRDDSHEGDSFAEPGFYQSLCVNTGYKDFLFKNTQEVMDLLGDKLDGLFFDIVGIRPCLCNACRTEMQQRGLDIYDDDAVLGFAKFNIDRFKKEMSEMIWNKAPGISIFYNAGHVGPCTLNSVDAYSHLELESLPSGEWGYLHFPAAARYGRRLNKDCIGMTGKFHTEWGDFHSLKNKEALEFECFRMLSYGFGCSIGDQLEPYGVLNPATYKLIGGVYSQIEEREEWARPSLPVAEVAVITPEKAASESRIPETILGASQMLEELGLQFDIVGADEDFTAYPLVILADDLVVPKEFHQRLDAYVKAGGKVIASCQGGLSDEGIYPACFATEYKGMQEKYPDFIVADGPLAQGLEENNEYVFYMGGTEIEPQNGSEILLSARAPYFKRQRNEFCSHRYTPSAKGVPYAAVTKTENTILFSHPIFGQYRQNAPRWCKVLMENAIRTFLPRKMVEHSGPSFMSVNVLHQPEKERYCAHVLSYIPIRKSATIDIIEDRVRLNNVEFTFTLPKEIKTARLIPSMQEVEIKEGTVVVPEIDGYQIIELNY